MFPKTSFPSRGFTRCILLGIFSSLVLSCMGAPDEGDSASSGQALSTITDAAVLGMESVDGWTLQSPWRKELSTEHTQGLTGLSVTAGGFTEIESKALSTLSRVPSKFYFDLRLPTNQVNPNWFGEVQLYVTLPSQNMFNAYLGQVELNGKPTGRFIELAYDVPEAVKAALNRSYTDLKIKIALNVPYGNAAYVLDDVRLDPRGPGENLPESHPYIRIGQDGRVRYAVTLPSTLPAGSTVSVEISKNGQPFKVVSLTRPERVSATSGASVFAYNDDVSGYQKGDKISVRFKVTGPSGTVEWRPGPGDDWSAPITYDGFQRTQPVFDRDGDGKRDVVSTAGSADGCPNDPRKTEAGLCGCGNSETDSDSDNVPDCLDRCPQDPNKYDPGDCGCAGKYAVLGTHCSDAPAVGTFICDGSGTCGDPASVRPSWVRGTIKSIVVDGRVIFYSTTDVETWGTAKLSVPPGYKLVNDDSALVNAVVKRIAKDAGTNQRVWTDGSGSVSDGIYHSAADNTTRVPIQTLQQSGYSKWTDGEPNKALGNGAVSVGADGKWKLETVDTRHIVIFERPRYTIVGGSGFPDVTCADFPNLTCRRNDDSACVPTPSNDEACRVCIEAHPTDSSQCSSQCPDVACSICLDANQGNEAACPICPKVPVGSTCSSTLGALCSVTPSNTSKLVACTTNADCKTAPDTQCGLYSNCSNSIQDTDGYISFNCKTTDSNGGCLEPCRSVTVCGAPGPSCGLEANNTGDCSETVICPDPNAVGNPDPAGYGLGSLATPTPFVEADVFGQPKPAVSVQYPDEPVSGTPANKADHPWCHYVVPKAVDDKTVQQTKAGSAGNGKAIQFDIDPNLTLDYSVEPLPQGQVQYNLTAEASLGASARFDFARINGSVDILDAKLSARANRCGYSTLDSKVEVFGFDFLPTLLVAAGVDRSKFLVDYTKAGCKEALEAHQEIADRAKKSMRDAIELVRQYHEGLKSHACFNPRQLCLQLMNNAPGDFPRINCDEPNLAIENVINLFIFHYNRQVFADASLPDLGSLKLTVPSGGPRFADVRLGNPNFSLDNLDTDINFGDFSSIGSLPNLSASALELSKFDVMTPSEIGKIGDGTEPEAYGCGPKATTERRTLFSTTFALGPIPMILEVESVLHYGLSGDLDYKFNLSHIADLATGATDASMPIATAIASATPCASAGVALFVGAGFKAFGFRATAGVNGMVELGKLVMPANATASLTMGAHNETLSLEPPPVGNSGATREIAEELKGLWDENTKIPARRYSLGIGYTYGASLTVDHILAGYLEAALQIKFWRWRKRWRKKIVDFGDGISLGTVKLISGENDFAITGSIPWGIIQMPSPFVKLRYLDRIPTSLVGLSSSELQAKLPSLNVSVPKLASLGLDISDLGNVSFTPQEVLDLSAKWGYGTLSSKLEAKGVNLDALSLADLDKLGFNLGSLSKVPVRLSDLRLLNLKAPQLATLGFGTAVLGSSLPALIAAQGWGLPKIGALNLPVSRTNVMRFRWQDVPTLSYLLKSPGLEADLEARGVDWDNLTMEQLRALGFEMPALSGMLLTGSQVSDLGLSLGDLGRLGLNLSGLSLDLSQLSDGAGDLANLRWSDLTKLGMKITDLGSIKVSRADLLNLSAQIDVPDIRQALGVSDLNAIKLSDFAKLGKTLSDFPDKSIRPVDMNLGASELQRLNLGQELSNLTGDSTVVCPSQPLDTSRVGLFFYDHQCTCRLDFDASKPSDNGRQSCFNDADCCSASSHCTFKSDVGYNVCGSTVCAPNDASCNPTLTAVVKAVGGVEQTSKVELVVKHAGQNQPVISAAGADARRGIGVSPSAGDAVVVRCVPGTNSIVTNVQFKYKDGTSSLVSSCPTALGSACEAPSVTFSQDFVASCDFETATYGDLGLGLFAQHDNTYVTVTITGQNSAVTSSITIVHPDGHRTLVGQDTEIGKRVGPIPMNGEVIVEISAGPYGPFQSGSGSRNPDGQPHAKVLRLGSSSYQVSFEDMRANVPPYRTPDNDFNDVEVLIEGDITARSP